MSLLQLCSRFSSLNSPLVCRLLTTFTEHSFKAHDLKAAVPLRSSNSYNSQHTDNFTRFTQDATNMTGQSDAELVMDPEDKERAVEDLRGFKVWLCFMAACSTVPNS